MLLRHSNGGVILLWGQLRFSEVMIMEPWENPISLKRVWCGLQCIKHRKRFCSSNESNREQTVSHNCENWLWGLLYDASYCRCSQKWGMEPLGVFTFLPGLVSRGTKCFWRMYPSEGEDYKQHQQMLWTFSTCWLPQWYRMSLSKKQKYALKNISRFSLRSKGFRVGWVWVPSSVYVV